MVENSCAITGQNRSFTFSYFQTLTGMLGAPGKFFENLPENVRMGFPLSFLTASALFFAGASLTCLSDNRLIMGAVYFANAVVMPFTLAGISYLIITMTMGRKVPFLRLFAVCSFAAGTTLLASWIPLFIWITEPWKWILTVIGMVKACGLGWIRSVVVMAVTIITMMLFFWSLAPVIVFTKGLLE